MNEESLKKLLPEAGKECIEGILAEHNKALEAVQNSVTRLTTERDGLKGQLDTATTTLKSYESLDVEGIKTAAKDWELKYNTETQALKEQLDAANYDFAVKEAISGYKFSCEAAKKSFVADLTAKKLPLQEGKLLGLEDFHKTYQEADPKAFEAENAGAQLYAVRGGTGAGGPIGGEGFGFHFTGVRAKTDGK